MDPYSDSSELYHLRQQFYSSRYLDLIKLDLKKDIIFNNEDNLYESYKYQIRSYISINEFEKGLELLRSINDEIPEHYKIDFKGLEYYIGFISQEKGEDLEFESFINENLNNQFVNLLGGLYYIKLNNFEKSIEILKKSKKSFENLSVLIYVNLLNLNLKDTELNLKEFNKISQDDFLYTLTQSWFELTKFNNSLNQSYYYYDELTNNLETNSIKFLLNLFTSNLKLLRIPESQEVLNKLSEFKTDNPNQFDLKQWECDFIINKIAFNYLKLEKGSDFEVDNLVNELKTLDSNNDYLLDLKEKNDIFDNIVTKYTV
ncbi:hypothetical protein CANARDRAFT_15495 [[Candida] arabinofermentans NRRL YB-2248]|uniref:Coatomer subunit epsilon n=1 Tax=[Candida] arabinofermentans NRRL YB-2248 TaxID=983967 RepID=A0A1E4T904_9ASCO|nr:hypothetical protein CANARDRAFT_15495 [[Candida] arabinofermentans NRRL YB-2248]